MRIQPTILNITQGIFTPGQLGAYTNVISSFYLVYDLCSQTKEEVMYGPPI